MSDTVLLLQPYIDVASGTANVFVGPDVNNSATTATLAVSSDTSSNQALLDVALVAAGYSGGDILLAGDSGSLSSGSGHGWTFTFQGSLADRNLPPLLAFDASGLTSSVSPSASYSAADGTYGQSYIAAVSGSAAVLTFNDSGPSVTGQGTPDWTDGFTDASSSTYWSEVDFTFDSQSLSYAPSQSSYPSLSGWTYASSGAGQFTLTCNADSPTGLSDGTINVLNEVYSQNPDLSVNAFYNVQSDYDVSGLLTFADGADPITGQPQIDRLTATASAGSLTITAGTFGTTAAIPWGPYADSTACCNAVAAALNAVVTGGGVTVAVNTGAGATSWSPSTWDLLITLTTSLGSQSWTVDGSGLTNGIVLQESVLTPGGAVGLRLSGVDGGIS